MVKGVVRAVVKCEGVEDDPALWAGLKRVAAGLMDEVAGLCAGRFRELWLEPGGAVLVGFSRVSSAHAAAGAAAAPADEAGGL